MSTYKVLLVSVALSLLVACATTDINNDPAAKYRGYTAQQLYIKGQKAISSGNYNDAVSLYEGLESLYPFEDYAQKGQINLIYAYYQSGDYASAVASANQYIHVYPRSSQIDYAYYMKGRSNMYASESWLQRYLPIDMSLRDLSDKKQAFYDFRDLVTLYPRSKYAPDARRHMEYLRNQFAQHELETAEYYLARHAYVAAANRASYIIRHYQHAPQVENALVIVVKANRALGLKDPANDALKVLRLNFPNSSKV